MALHMHLVFFKKNYHSMNVKVSQKRQMERSIRFMTDVKSEPTICHLVFLQEAFPNSLKQFGLDLKNMLSNVLLVLDQTLI